MGVAEQHSSSTDQGGRGRFAGFWQRFEHSSIPLGLKWSLSIATLIVFVMGLLGFFLIQHQSAAYRGQADRYSQLILEQIGQLSGEPLMAGDSLNLQIILKRYSQNPLILGVAVLDSRGAEVTAAGRQPPGPRPNAPATGEQTWEWRSAGQLGYSYLKSIDFKDVTAGYLLASFDRSSLEAELSRTKSYLALSTGLLILLGVFLAAGLAHRLSRPIKHLARAGEVLAEQPLMLPQRRDEIGQVMASFQQFADGIERKKHVEGAFSRYVSPQVAQHVLEAERHSALGGQSVAGSVLFCDIVGFTALSEDLEPAQIAELLNDYFAYFAAAAEICGGTVDKFIGDCIMIVFGAPYEDPHHELHALTCGVLVQQLVRRINPLRKQGGLEAVTLRVGASSGPMLAGNLGSADRMQFTVVGDTVNIAARLCGLSAPGGVLLPAAMMKSGFPGDLEHYVLLENVQLRGRSERVDLREMDVDGVARDIDVDQLIDEVLSRVRH